MRLSVRQSIFSGFLILTLLAVGVGVASYVLMDRTNNRYNNITLANTSLFSQAEEIKSLMLQLRSYEKDLFLNIGKPEKQHGYMEKFTVVSDRMSRLLEDLSGTGANAPDEVKSLVQGLPGLYDAYRKGFTQVSAAVLKDPDITPQKANELMTPYKQPIHDLEKNIDEFSTAATSTLTQSLANNLDSAKKSMWLLLIFIGVGAAACLGLGALLSSRISRPIKSFVGFCEKLRQGDLNSMDTDINQSVKGQGSDLGLMRDYLNQVVVELNRKTKAAEAMAAGDLRQDINLMSDKDSLGLALKDLVEQLNRIVTQLFAAADQVASGSGQISDSSQALSQGATEQAASIEQITSSMTELGSQTDTNAQNAAEANRLAQDSQSLAEKGVSQMEEMMVAIGAIRDSSDAIAKIIKVIDDIAFQTNLLALNAAVEAARAGKHGKGFAVVAQEVRNLAGRSAKAASETSELITDTVNKVEKGTSSAENTVDALIEIVEGVSKVTDLIGEINEASNEQALGIAQINQGLNQIEQVTQQNTATAEQTASASEELYSQAEDMRKILSQFKIRKSENGDRRPPARNFEMREPLPAPRAASIDHWGEAEVPADDQRLAPEDVIKLDDDDFGKY